MKHEGRGHLEIVGLDGNIILKWILKNARLLTEWDWLRESSRGWLLWTLWWNFEFHKEGTSLASWATTVFCSMQFVIRLKHDIVKVKLPLCLTKHHAMKTYWEWRYSAMNSWSQH
jgi:tRNA-dihydrouridine synthase